MNEPSRLNDLQCIRDTPRDIHLYTYRFYRNGEHLNRVACYSIRSLLLGRYSDCGFNRVCVTLARVEGELLGMDWFVYRLVDVFIVWPCPRMVRNRLHSPRAMPSRRSQPSIYWGERAKNSLGGKKLVKYRLAFHSLIASAWMDWRISARIP